MADASSKSAVIKAVLGNGTITIAKGIATFVSGSGAMMAETIHSLVDTLNQCLLLLGHQRSLRKPTAKHPYGFGPEADFWGLLAAIGILVFGGLWTLQHGIAALFKPVAPTNVPLVLGILAFATIVEAWVLWVILKDLERTRNGVPWMKHIKAQPGGTLTVLLEDAAAVLGCLIAAAAISMSWATGNGIYDAIAQVLIGSVLSIVGLVLIIRNRGILIGEALPADKVNEIRAFIEDLEGIDRVTDLKTRQLTAFTFRLKAEVVFSGGELAGPKIPEYTEKAAAARTADERAEVLGRFADAIFEEQARHVDLLEKRIEAAFPGVRHIDLEPHLREPDDAPVADSDDDEK